MSEKKDLAQAFAPHLDNFEMNSSILSDLEFRPILAPQKISKSGFFPPNLLVPSWTGEGLISKEALFLRKALEVLWRDCEEQLISLNEPNRSLKTKIHDEFLDYLSREQKDQITEHSELFDNHDKLYDHLTRKDAACFEILNDFRSLYCFRATIIYLFKVRFISSLKGIQGHPVQNIDLLNPNTYLTKIFQKGSNSDLHCESLEPNAYSWYRPRAHLTAELDALFEIIKDISTTELMKIFTYAPFENKSSTHINYTDHTFSHSLSHKSFGLFLNSIIIHLPHWLSGKSEKVNYIESPRLPTTLLTKVTGNYLSSLALSHWLAQEQNMTTRWSEIICSDFIGEEFDNGEFFKICHELYFLSILVKVAKEQVRPTLELITTVMKEKYSRLRNGQGQMSIFQNVGRDKTSLKYDRIVLNLDEIKSKNPFNSLLAKITKEGKQLELNGYLYVFTNQKLFVPSKSDKIEDLQKEYCPVANFSFENLKGRGEIPSFLYVLRKDGLHKQSVGETQIAKSVCLTFEFSGELTQFNRFFSIIHEFVSLLKTKDFSSTPLIHRTVGENLYIEYHQDVLLGGKLVHANLKETASVTHPNFFKNLTEACIPLETLFQIDSLPSKGDSLSPTHDPILGFTIDPYARYPYSIIVDYTHPHHVQIELIDTSLLRAKREEYGTASYQYFGLIPKITPINLNLLRYFFESSLGTQIIGLTLTSADIKTKSKLRALLIPKFIANHQTIKESDRDALGFLINGKSELLSNNSYEKSLKLLRDHIPLLKLHIKNYPWIISSHLVEFKDSLKNLSKQITSPQNAHGIDFNLGPVREALIKLDSYPVLSKQSDIHFEFKASSKEKYRLPLTFAELKVESGMSHLSIKSGNELLLEAHGHILSLEFIKFIIDRAYGKPVDAILQALKTPSAIDLENLMMTIRSQNNHVTEMINICQSLLDELFAQQIQQKR